MTLQASQTYKRIYLGPNPELQHHTECVSVQPTSNTLVRGHNQPILKFRRCGANLSPRVTHWALFAGWRGTLTDHQITEPNQGPTQHVNSTHEQHASKDHRLQKTLRLQTRDSMSNPPGSLYKLERNSDSPDPPTSTPQSAPTQHASNTLVRYHSQSQHRKQTAILEGLNAVPHL